METEERCPYCNSKKLQIYVERIDTYYYDINEEDLDTAKPVRISKNTGTNALGYYCKKCDSFIPKLAV